MNSLFRRLFHEQDGQALYLFAALLIVLLAMAALSIDIGFALHAQRELQASADAAATAGALDLPNSTATAIAKEYDGESTGMNYYPDLPGVQMASGYPATTCVTTIVGAPPCNSTTPNAILVEETVTVPLFFARVFTSQPITLTARAEALAPSVAAVPYNIVVIVDTTASMQNPDTACPVPPGWPGNATVTREDCAKAGVATLLGELAPCASNLTSCGTVTSGNVQNPVQEVALYIFPGLGSSSNPGAEYDCWTQSPGIVPYTTSTNYQAIGLSSDYKTSDSSDLNAGNSNLVDAITWTNQSSQCLTVNGSNLLQYGLQDPGGEHTFYAQAITTAQAMLQGARQNVQNVIILLSDGDANATGSQILPAWAQNECAQGVSAAQAATAQNTWVYSIAYGAQTSGCSTDGGAYTPCSAMQAIASDASKFYTDNQAVCPSSAHPSITSLNQIFSDIVRQFSNTRLIEWGTT